jgi:hypothetical protein
MILQQFKAARRAGVPIVAIESADPAVTIAECVSLLNGKLPETTLAEWDIIRGLCPVMVSGKPANEKSTKFVSTVNPNGVECSNPAECLKVLAEKTPEQSIIFFHNSQRLIDDASIAQGIWNLRDVYKGSRCTLVLLCPMLTLPSELKQDVVIISEPLPDTATLEKITNSILKDAELPALKSKDLERVTDILRGLSGFAAEQVLAMSINAEGVQMDSLWERKRKMIEQTPGLSVWQGGETFDDLGGLSNLKTFLTRVLTSGNTPVRAIGFIDEIEKGLAGSAGDTSGTSQDQLQVFLKVMQDLNIPGIILLGPAGTGKSAIAKAAGNVAQCPVVAIDTGSMKGSLVGESERRIRAAMEVFKAVSQGKGLFIATCNKIASLPPELRRRFTLGTFFVDLPTEKDRAKIWSIWTKRYSIKTQPLPDSEDWTGAEIRACCDVAFRTGLSLLEAAAFIVPVAKSAPDQVETLRTLAAGRFICANNAGVYTRKTQTTATGRKMEVN